jgi:hypothetical protein
MNAFVAMREFIHANRDVFANIATINNRLTGIDNKLVEHDNRFDEVFDLLQTPETAKQSIFFAGQFYDAFTLVIELIQKAKRKLTIIDNYLSEAVLDMLTHKNTGVSVTFITSAPNRLGKQHLEKFVQQYGEVAIFKSKVFHDRFVIIDDTEVYAFGASLKDAGNTCFEVSRNESTDRFVEYVMSIMATESPVTT